MAATITKREDTTTHYFDTELDNNEQKEVNAPETLSGGSAEPTQGAAIDDVPDETSSHPPHIDGNTTNGETTASNSFNPTPSPAPPSPSSSASSHCSSPSPSSHSSASPSPEREEEEKVVPASSPSPISSPPMSPESEYTEGTLSPSASPSPSPSPSSKHEIVPTPPRGKNGKGVRPGVTSPRELSPAKLKQIGDANEELSEKIAELRGVVAQVGKKQGGQTTQQTLRGGYGGVVPHGIEAALEQQTKWYRKENERIRKDLGPSANEESQGSLLSASLKRHEEKLREQKSEHRRLTAQVSHATKALEKVGQKEAMLERTRTAARSDEEVCRKRISQVQEQFHRYNALVAATEKELAVLLIAADGTPEIPNAKIANELRAQIADREKRVEGAAYQLSIVRRCGNSEKEKLRRTLKDAKLASRGLIEEKARLESTLARKKAQLSEIPARAARHHSNSPTISHLRPLQNPPRPDKTDKTVPKVTLNSTSGSFNPDDIPSCPSTPPEPPMQKSPEPLSEAGDTYRQQAAPTLGDMLKEKGGGGEGEEVAEEERGDVESDGAVPIGVGELQGDASSSSGSSAPPTEEDFDAEAVASAPSRRQSEAVSEAIVDAVPGGGEVPGNLEGEVEEEEEEEGKKEVGVVEEE